MRYHDSILQESNRDSEILKDSLAVLNKYDFPEDEISNFMERSVDILDNCSRHFDAGTRIHYTVSRRLGRVKMRFVLQGERYNPLPDEEDTPRVSMITPCTSSCATSLPSPQTKVFRGGISSPCIRRQKAQRKYPSNRRCSGASCWALSAD